MLPTTLLPLLHTLPDAKVLCVGDIMLDRYVFGQVNRISPEAPVPVLSVKERRLVLGGVGNVAANLSSLGLTPHLISVIGDDSMGSQLLALAKDRLKGAHIQMLRDQGRQTSIKTRHIVNIQQLLRTDDESTHPVNAMVTEQIMALILKSIQHVSAVILSDYGKGLLTPDICQQIIQAARKIHCPVLIDPKGADYSKYSGATYITPNKAELALASGMPTNTDAEVIKAAQSLLHRHDLAGIVATRGAQGMTLVLKSGDVTHLPTQAIEVYDVSGAGDTVIATLAAGLAAKGSVLDAMYLANAAAGIVVAKTGTATASLEELETALASKFLGLSHLHKIFSHSQAARQVHTWKQQGLRVGFTNGCFDILHTGHLSLLNQARSQCDRLIIGLNTDASVRRLKGSTRPINHEDDRATMLAALQNVDGVVLFDEDTPLNIITLLLPDVLVKGADYRIDQVVGADVVQNNGGTVYLAELKQGYSTTGLVQKMQGGS